MASSSELSGKWGRVEEDDDESRHHWLVKEGTALEPEKPEEVSPPPPPPDEPEEVPPPPPDEPEEALAPQPVEAVSAPPLTADEATWSVNLFHDAFVRLRWVAVHLGVPVPNDPLQRTVKDYSFKTNILAGELERGVLAPVDDDDDNDGSLDSSGSDSDSGAPPEATTSA
jgi:hypothetical protein